MIEYLDADSNNYGLSPNCSVPYIVPVAALLLGAVVIVAALGWWAIGKLRLW